jgi:Xaa-Pro aminopeptidase
MNGTTQPTERCVQKGENVVEVAFLAMTVPGVCGMRLEYPVLVTENGGEPLCKTPIELTVIDP